MRPEITEPIRKIRKALMLVEVDLDDVGHESSDPGVEHNLQKIEKLIQELREVNRA
jgi:tRNA pseudouridine-54 N-methylase